MKKLKLLILTLGTFMVILTFVFFITTKNTENIPVSTPASSNAIVVAPQLVAKTVTVKSVSLTNPGFLVVREIIDGKLGQMIGVSDYVLFGTTENVLIKLYSIPRDNAQTLVQVFTDNGDGKFSDTLDKPVLVNDTPLALGVEDGKSVPSSLWQSNSALIPEERITRISYDGATFSPSEVTIVPGDTVVFTNSSQGSMWVASDPHPDHSTLSTFDQFGASDPGAEYRYTFAAEGEWRFHDHINPRVGGTVIVKNKAKELMTSKTKNVEGYYEVSSEDFETLTVNPDVITVNVHTPYASEIKDTELQIPYDDTKALIAALPADTSAPIALYCRSGAMSTVAARALVAAGYSNIYELSGGMQAYQTSGRVLITQIP